MPSQHKKMFGNRGVLNGKVPLMWFDSVTQLKNSPDCGGQIDLKNPS